MAQNLVTCGDVFEVTAGGTLTSGQALLMGDMLGVVLGDAVSGQKVSVAVEGVFILPKVASGSGKAIAQGAKVYWVTASSSIDNTDNSAANKHVGYAYVAALTGDTTVQVRLLG